MIVGPPIIASHIGASERLALVLLEKLIAEKTVETLVASRTSMRASTTDEAEAVEHQPAERHVTAILSTLGQRRQRAWTAATCTRREMGIRTNISTLSAERSYQYY